MGGQAARVLCELASWEPEDYSIADPFKPLLTARFRLLNLLEAWPGEAVGKGTVWPLALAQEGAEKIAALIARGTWDPDLTVLLGKRAAAACGLRRSEYFEWQHVPGLNLHGVVIPHPSGVNRRLNERGTRARAGEVLREAAGK